MSRRKDSKPSEPLKGKVPPGHPLFEIIEEAYRAFDRPKPTSTEVCENCCMDRAIETNFFRPAIKELPLHYVQDWFDAAAPVGGVSKETWAYLLPRILEILAADEDASLTAPEVTLTRFDTGNPDNWSARQWAVLDRFQRAFLKRKVEAQDRVVHDALDDVLCMFARGGWPLAGLLDQVAAMPDAVLAGRLWQDWCEGRVGNDSIWLTPFWTSPDNSTVFEFFTSPALYERMSALALAEDTEPELAAKALAVVGVIEMSA